jgi:hypothetical protein
MTAPQIQSRLAHCENCEARPSCRETFLAYDSETTCPLGKWSALTIGTSLAHAQYGDAVKRIAEPVARIVDRVARTNLQGCGPCAERRNLWNQGGVDIPRIP